MRARKYISPLWGEGGARAERGRVRAVTYTPYASGSNTEWIVVRTPSKSRSTSPFQKGNTKNPHASTSAVRRASYVSGSACWLPSSSITSLASMHAKSATYPLMGYWRLNFRPVNCRFLSRDHNKDSASVWFRRSVRANDFAVTLIAAGKHDVTLPSTDYAPHPPVLRTGPSPSPMGRGGFGRTSPWPR